MNELNELDLNNIKNIEIGLLKHVREFCKEHNIKYFLSNGTLLGAVKYKGFIPWDDDIDVLIPRKDYDYFIKEYIDNDYFKLFSPERVYDYRFPFAKLCDMRTRRVEWNNDNGVDLGIDIDIFPLDNWEDNYRLAEKQAKKQFLLMTLLRFAKNKKIYSSKRYKYLPKKLIASICRKVGPLYFINKMQIEAKKSISESSYVGCIIWPVYNTKEIVPAKIFADTIKVEFEGEEYDAPVGYDTYLRSLYGDYEQDPPIDKQKTHHNFKAYKII